VRKGKNGTGREGRRKMLSPLKKFWHRHCKQQRKLSVDVCYCFGIFIDSD